MEVSTWSEQACTACSKRSCLPRCLPFRGAHSATRRWRCRAVAHQSALRHAGKRHSNDWDRAPYFSDRSHRHKGTAESSATGDLTCRSWTTKNARVVPRWDRPCETALLREPHQLHGQPRWKLAPHSRRSPGPENSCRRADETWSAKSHGGWPDSCRHRSVPSHRDSLQWE